MPEPLMRFHPLAPEVKCPACGAAGLKFIRVRGFGDLYQCGSGGPCKWHVMHYRNRMSKTCGYSALSAYGTFGEWTACGETAAKGER